MYGRIVLSVLLALVVVAVLAGIGFYAYNAGIAQGMVDSGKLVTPTTGMSPSPYFGGRFFYHPFGFGFLGCLMPLLVFFLICGLLRGIFWHGRWGGHHRHWENGYPPMLEEWHRKMHEPKTTEK